MIKLNRNTRSNYLSDNKVADLIDAFILELTLLTEGCI
jgi:hypothetical protein